MVRILSCRSSMIAAVVAVTSLFAATGADAKQVGPFTVKSGVPTIVLSYASYDPEMCTFQALPTYRIVQAPAHGTIAIGKSSNALADGPCKGKSMRSSTVEYRSTSGYRGTDQIIVDAEMADYTDGSGHRGIRVIIDVVVK